MESNTRDSERDSERGSERVRLEHANLIVRDIDEMTRFLKAAFPEFRVRREGKGWHGTRWLHVGTDTTYVAFSEASDSQAGRIPHDGPGFNHLGFVVDDAERVAASLREAGYREGFQADPHPHRKRIYFHDSDDNEWEFVEYLSDDPQERNDYSL